MPTALLAIAHLTVSSAHAQADRTWEAAALLRETQVAGFGESVASGDFDGDGVQELALGHPAEQRFYVFDLESDFDGGQTYNAPDGQTDFSQALCAGDVDGDGTDDLVVTAAPRYGTSNPQPALLYLGSDDGLQAPSELPLPSDWVGTDSLGTLCLVADLDADGRAEILLSDPGATLPLLRYPGGGDAPPEPLNSTDGNSCAAFTAADWDADGYTDWACAGEHDGDAKLWIHPGGPQLGEPESHQFSNIGPLTALTSGDLDGDQIPELILGFPEADSGAGLVRVLWGDPRGVDPDDKQELKGEGLQAFGAWLSTSGDLDGDTRELLVGANEDDLPTIQAFSSSRLGVGDLAWTEQPAGERLLWLLGPVDLDGDGSSDVVVGTEGFVEVYLGSPYDCETPSSFYLDNDRDGYGDPALATTACEPPEGYVDNDQDCDDSAPELHPDAPELCDEVDNDCDGFTDEDPSDGESYGIDADEDGYTTGNVRACEEPGGDWVPASEESDCDDSDDAVHPGATEVAGDGIDNDCEDGELDPEVLSNAAGLTGEDGGLSCSSTPAPTSWAWLLALGTLITLRRQRGQAEPAATRSE